MNKLILLFFFFVTVLPFYSEAAPVQQITLNKTGFIIESKETKRKISLIKDDGDGFKVFYYNESWIAYNVKLDDDTNLVMTFKWSEYSPEGSVTKQEVFYYHENFTLLPHDELIINPSKRGGYSYSFGKWHDLTVIRNGIIIHNVKAYIRPI